MEQRLRATSGAYGEPAYAELEVIRGYPGEGIPKHARLGIMPGIGYFRDFGSPGRA